MALQLQISTLGGQQWFQDVEAGCRVRDVKHEIEKVALTPWVRQKLVSIDGEELENERALIEYCSIVDGVAEVLAITLVEVAKCELELQHLETWEKETPGWLKQATNEVLNPGDFRMKLAYASKRGLRDCPLHPKSMGCRCMVANTSRGYSGVEPKSQTIPLISSRRLMSLLHDNPKFEMYSVGDHVSLTLDRTLGAAAKASLATALEAIVQAPFLVLPRADYVISKTAVGKYQGIYNYLQKDFRDDRDLLYVALEADPDLKAEFLATAGKQELNEWRWHLKQSSKRSSDARNPQLL